MRAPSITAPQTTVAVAAALLALGDAVAASPGSPGAQDSTSKIVFVNDWNGRDAPDEIYVMNPDGSAPRRLTVTASGNNLFPRWSPDGTRIAFSSTRDGQPAVYVIQADGAALTRLTLSDSAWPTWSPDGQRLAFVSRSPQGTTGLGEISVINADGTGLTPLTRNASVVGHPDWSPDGRRIAFVTNRDGNPEIYAMNADGTAPVRLTFNSAGDNGPKWSPDGKRIAFQSERDGNWEIYVMNADGTGQVRLTTDPRLDAWPSWSPDGKRIAFMRQVEVVPGLRSPNGSEVFEMNADGSKPTRVTHTTPAAFNAFPDWGPLHPRGP